MSKSKELKLDLPSVDELFTTEEERLDANREKVQEIPLDQIEDFPNHPFKIKEDEAIWCQRWSGRKQMAAMRWWPGTGENAQAG